MDFIANLTGAKSIRRRTADRLRVLDVLFREVCDEGSELTLDQFKKVIKTKNTFFVERIFKIFDKDQSNTVSRDEFFESIKNIVFKSVDDKLRLLFQIYDLDGDDQISLVELRHVMQCCMEENGLLISEDDLDYMTRTLFEDADVDSTGAITFDKMGDLFRRNEGLIENLSTTMERWLLPPLPDEKQQPEPKRRKGWLRKCSISYIANNFVSCTFFIGFVLVNLVLFIARLHSYSHTNLYVMFARACGQCLNFTSTFTLILVLRKCITALRSSGLSEYLPLDQHIYYHKLTGAFIVFYSILHTIMHCLNFRLISQELGIPYLELLFSTELGIGWVKGSACLTGWLLLAILIVMVVSSMPFMRRSGYFEVFYYCHLLYVPYYLLLIAHAPNFYKWFLLPCLIYLMEVLIRAKNSFGWHGRTLIQRGTVLPSRVIHLVVKKPPGFEFRPGDWIFVQIPAITTAEWHPFTISSAPEMADVLWLHIRAAGQWTNRVLDYYMAAQESSIKRRNRTLCLRGQEFDRSIVNSACEYTMSGDRAERPLPILIDGPYGSPTSHIFSTQHAVLIATGIGVTPFASILQSIMFRYINARHVCPSCEHSWSDPGPPLMMQLKKVDFVWINRDQKSFEWFVNLLSELEITQAKLNERERFLDIHMYVTSAIDKADMKAIGLQLALDLMHEKSNRDLITGLKTRTNAGRPDWNEFFGKIAAQHKGKVGVYFCGSPELGRVLQSYCIPFGFNFCKENF